jgi:hypothetical protein
MIDNFQQNFGAGESKIGKWSRITRQLPHHYEFNNNYLDIGGFTFIVNSYVSEQLVDRERNHAERAELHRSLVYISLHVKFV